MALPPPAPSPWPPHSFFLVLAHMKEHKPFSLPLHVPWWAIALPVLSHYLQWPPAALCFLAFLMFTANPPLWQKIPKFSLKKLIPSVSCLTCFFALLLWPAARSTGTLKPKQSRPWLSFLVCCKLLICCKVGEVAQEVKVPLKEKYGVQIRLHLVHLTWLAPMTVDCGCDVELSVCSASTDHAKSKDALILCD